jgi:hypothetical protein
MKSKDGFVQAYNTQTAVDTEAQIIVAHDVTQSAGDSEANLKALKPGQRRRYRPRCHR